MPQTRDTKSYSIIFKKVTVTDCILILLYTTIYSCSDESVTVMSYEIKWSWKLTSLYEKKSIHNLEGKKPNAHGRYAGNWDSNIFERFLSYIKSRFECGMVTW